MNALDLVREERAKMENLAAEIERNPMTKRFREEEAAITLATRKAAVARIEALQRELESHLTKQVEIDEMGKELAALDNDRKELQAAINSKLSSFWQEKNGFLGEIRQQKEILYSTYDPKIDEVITWSRDKLEYLRKPGRITVSKMGKERNIFTMMKKVTVESNENALYDAMQYCRSAIAELEGMKLIPELNLARIEKFKAGLPRIDIFREFSGEKPMERIDANPRFKSDDQLAWEMGKLLKKGKELLARPRP
jgi:hypothetical protein